jgi:DNA-directed RNA polymerase specialized sigma54-like protein
LDDLKQAIERLRELDLSPGADYDEDLAAVITPDVIVEELDGRFEVRLARDRQPNLRISPIYRELLAGMEQDRKDPRVTPEQSDDRYLETSGLVSAGDSGRAGLADDPEAAAGERDFGAQDNSAQAQPDRDAEGTSPAADSVNHPNHANLAIHVNLANHANGAGRQSREPEHLDDPDDARRWARRKLESARWFIEAVEQRGGTMLRIAKAIFRRQERFLTEGPKGLVPLRMQEVADETGVHISTVSRAVAGKYAQTPRGIQPLKYFFTSGTTDSSGEAQSQVGIQQRLAELVRAEDPQAPLSDDQIAAELLKREGIRLARRTVTKYRLALGLPSSSQRKRF